MCVCVCFICGLKCWNMIVLLETAWNVGDWCRWGCFFKQFHGFLKTIRSKYIERGREQNEGLKSKKIRRLLLQLIDFCRKTHLHHQKVLIANRADTSSVCHPHNFNFFTQMPLNTYQLLGLWLSWNLIFRIFLHEIDL